jgi:hypothetical protein
MLARQRLNFSVGDSGDGDLEPCWGLKELDLSCRRALGGILKTFVVVFFFRYFLHFCFSSGGGRRVWISLGRILLEEFWGEILSALLLSFRGCFGCCVGICFQTYFFLVPFPLGWL